MNALTTIFVLAAAFLAVFCQSAFQGLRHVLGAQIDLLPPLMVYASLCGGLPSVALLSLLGGLFFDALSANPLGVTVLPLFIVGLVIYLSREVILRHQAFAQFVIGLAASAAAPALTLLLLLTMGHAPLFGWGTLWQWIIMSLGGACATPLCFLALDWLEGSLVHGRVSESSFRPDREIRRGR